MRYFLDTEFIDDGRTIDLISIGLVAEDGRQYYAISSEFKARRANPWVRTYVLSLLPDRNAHPGGPYSPSEWEAARVWKPRRQIRAEVLNFIADGAGKPEFWADYAAYDWVALCQLFGPMEGLPAVWPYYCNDLQQLLRQAEVEYGHPIILPKSARPHHALYDALAVGSGWELLYTEYTRVPA